MGFASGVENGDGPVTVELDFKDPVRRIERRFRTFRHHGRHNENVRFIVTAAPFWIRTTVNRSYSSIRCAVLKENAWGAALNVVQCGMRKMALVLVAASLLLSGCAAGTGNQGGQIYGVSAQERGYLIQSAQPMR
jgi:hypothetical protein